MDRGGWWATVHGVAKSWIHLTHTCMAPINFILAPPGIPTCIAACSGAGVHCCTPAGLSHAHSDWSRFALLIKYFEYSHCIYREDQFKKEGIVKRCSISPIIRATQIKTPVRYHLTVVRMVIIKMSTNYQCWRGCRKKGTLLHCWWECKLVQPLWRTVWRLLKKLKIKLP